MSKVFLSYPRDKKPYVRAVAEELSRRGVESWVEESELELGDEFGARVGEALTSANVVVVFLDDLSPTSSWQNFEIGAAWGGDKSLVTVFLSGDPSRATPSILARSSGIKAHDLKPEQVAAQIAEAIDALPAVS